MFVDELIDEVLGAGLTTGRHTAGAQKTLSRRKSKQGPAHVIRVWEFWIDLEHSLQVLFGMNAVVCFLVRETQVVVETRIIGYLF
jgi:hypothetical protein